MRQRRPAALDRALQMLDHARPAIGLVVRAVDAHAVHALLDELRHQRVVVGGLAGHGHHDRDAATVGTRPQRRFGVRIEQALSFGEIDGVITRRFVGVRDPGKPPERVEHRVDRRQHVGLGAPERREACGGQLMLERAQVAAAQRQVMQQVASARAMVGMHVLRGDRRNRRRAASMSRRMRSNSPIRPAHWSREMCEGMVDSSHGVL